MVEASDGGGSNKGEDGAPDAAPPGDHGSAGEKGGEPAAPEQAVAEASNAASTEEAVDDEIMEEVMKLAEAKDLEKACALLMAQLKKNPQDDQLMHNLGVIFTEQGYWADAEEIFMKAFEIQRQSTTKKVNHATMYGLGTVLTEQGTTMKLLQGEAFFRDCLQAASDHGENGVQDSYRCLCSLADNLERQKRWNDAVETWRPTVDFAKAMFGESHERFLAHKRSLDRAEKLARWQKGMRMVLWGITLATPVFAAWAWQRAGLGSIGDAWSYLLGYSAAEKGAAGDQANASGSPKY